MVRFDTTRAASSGDGTFLPHGPCAIESGGYGRGKHEREVLVFGESESKNIPFLSFFLEKFHYVYNLP